MFYILLVGLQLPVLTQYKLSRMSFSFEQGSNL